MKRDTAAFFQCVVADQPHYLVPSRLLPEDVNHCARSDLVMNPYCWFSWEGTPPCDIARRLPTPRRFRPDLDMVWVHDPSRRTATPFWVGRRFREAISHLR